MTVYYSNELLGEGPHFLLDHQKLRDNHHLCAQVSFHTILRTQTSSIITEFRQQTITENYVLCEKDTLAIALNHSLKWYFSLLYLPPAPDQSLWVTFIIVFLTDT